MNTARTWLLIIVFGVTIRTLYTLRIAPTLRKNMSSGPEDALTLVSMGILLIASAHHFSFIATRRRQGASVSPLAALWLLMFGILAISTMAYAIGRLG